MYQLTGIGGCREVGRSAFVLAFGERFLLDYGIKLGTDEIGYPQEIKRNIKSIILSHAHLDHSGLIPYYYATSECPSFMTQPTVELSDLLWRDSVKIAELEHMIPKYSETEIKKTHRYNFVLPYKKKTQIAHDVSLEFFDAGHILGSALTKLSHNDNHFLYTGDFKVAVTRLHSGADLKVGKVDYLMIESTYGNREHPDRKKEEKRFCESVEETVDRGGYAVVPAFAVGRSQEVIDVLSKYNISVPIYLDGMSKKAAQIYNKHADLIRDSKGLRKALSEVVWITGKGTREKAMKEPSVIVTTSGMMQGGPVMFYAGKIANQPNSKIFLTGFQVKGTPGNVLLETGRLPLGKDRKLTKVNCKYEKYDFSAHPGQAEMIQAIKKWSPREIFLVHGDKDVMPLFAKKIKDETGINATILETGKEVEFE
ncbi:MAG: MBL fold metallo-hydrolase [Candidatus Diapherotrites archaeon]|nr:MBL fold metallo-hydrolase [Candidatus Diapherotrites archaeon]